ALTFIAIATSGFADSVTEPTAEPDAIAPFPVDTSPNWTGFWVGGQLGLASVGANQGFGDEEGFIAGLTAGYDYDFGTFVLGGGIDYDLTDTEIGNTGADLESVFRVRLRAGFEIGRGLLYGTGGYAQADTDSLGSDDGYFLGAGYEYLVNPSFSYGGEVLFQEFSDYGNTPVDVDATTIQLRGTFRF
ncbi:MAG: outer membrane beta-barrel protein, partial [Pseudomonadota bacterium]